MKTPLSTKEQRVGLAILLYSAIAIAILWVPQISSAAAKKNHSNPKLYLAEGLALILIAGFGILRKNRILTAVLMILVAFGPWGKYVVLPLPVLAYGSFVLFKKDPAAIKARREAVAHKRELRSQGKYQPTTTPGGKSVPKPSKRYTPPANAINVKSRSKSK
ncbi:MAG: hypothetical protein HKL82_11880 [Acidimicrobiaceae bacterium]|nr:hypothetical protein [Acidimicrobiaceae bacterium]